MKGDDVAIVTDDLGRSFGDLRALQGVSLEIPKGSVFGLLGPNGAGKTTMIRILLGLLAPDRGHARVLGHALPEGGSYVRERTGALLEHTGLYERLSVRQNLDFFGRIWRMDGRQRARRVRELLERFGLWQRRDETVGKLSRGMKQKLAIARTLIHCPELVFLDEPTAGLDPVAATELRQDLARLVQTDGVTVFLTTHNLVEAERLCDQVGVISQGRLRAVGSPQALRAASTRADVVFTGSGFDASIVAQLEARKDVIEARIVEDTLRVRLADGVPAAPIVRAVVLAGGEVEEVRRGASLEDFFLELMEEAE